MMILRHLLSILALPFTVAVVIPAMLLRQERAGASLVAQLSGGPLWAESCAVILLQVSQ